MNNEHIERRMAFIIEQQAQFASDIQQLREAQAQTDQIVARLANATLEGFKDVNVKISPDLLQRRKRPDTQSGPACRTKVRSFLVFLSSFSHVGPTN